MISVAEAKEILSGSIKSMPSCSIAIGKAAGYVLARDIRATADNPRFDQSAVDGYVIMDTAPATQDVLKYVVHGELKAGCSPVSRPASHGAYRIFTGAPVPEGAYAVVMQEHVRIGSDTISFSSSFLKSGSHIRRRANHFKKRELLLSKGTMLGAPAIGLLASQGIAQVSVHEKPRISVLVTGDELVRPGKKAKPGSVYESNSFMLHAALSQSGFMVQRISRAPDQAARLVVLVRKSLEDSDTLIITGGISVGEYDLVRKCLDELGVRPLFHKVAQKPGKPLYAGVKGRKIVFGLPGNPAAVMVCFLQYVLPAVRTQAGSRMAFSSPEKSVLAHDFDVKGDRDQFVRGRTVDNEIHISKSQDSDNLHSFASADVLVHIPAGIVRLTAGDEVNVYPFH